MTKHKYIIINIITGELSTVLFSNQNEAACYIKDQMGFTKKAARELGIRVRRAKLIYDV